MKNEGFLIFYQQLSSNGQDHYVLGPCSSSIFMEGWKDGACYALCIFEQRSYRRLFLPFLAELVLHAVELREEVGVMVVQLSKGLCKWPGLLVPWTAFDQRTSAPAMLLCGGYCACSDIVMRVLICQSAYL